MWNWGRALRDLPPVNYAESSSSSEENYEEGLNFNSPLQSPRRPLNTREGSPVELFHPPLRDNVDEDLELVNYRLGDIAQVTEDVEELTDQLQQQLVPEKNKNPKKSSGVESEEDEVVFNFKVNSDGGEVSSMPNNQQQPAAPAVPGQPAAPAPPVRVNFDAEAKEDGDKAADHARHIKVEFDKTNIKFWFSQLEDEMEMAGVGKQWLKKSVLQRNLPLKQKEDVKAYLSLQKENAGPHIYLDIKNELIRIYAAKPCDSYRRALTRTMTGLPSQLGYQIIDDICKQPQKLVGCCCPAAAQALWSNQLPLNIRAHISDNSFTSDTYKQVFEKAD